MFAIVDIETTGGYGNSNCITEIAIIQHNGKEVEKSFHTLINPQSPINWYVQKMTGITNEMVSKAPLFSDVASQIFDLLQNRIFVAHNVNFDYSFVKLHLKNCNYHIDLAKICTVKLSRKVFPGLPKYGLGFLCQHFKIENIARHRAIGDATATAKLLEIIIESDKLNEIAKQIKKRKSYQYLPPNLNNTDVLDDLPSLPGVYYFYNNKEKIVYVGKAINLRKRVISHFSNNKTSKQKQDFLKEIYKIKFKLCSSELTAQILESTEIKKYWPKFNKSQKFYERRFGIFLFEDSLGYKRLAIDNVKKVLHPIKTFSLLVEARQYLIKYAEEFDIQNSMFFLSNETVSKLPNLKKHNKKVDAIIKIIKTEKQTYLVHDGTGTYILVEENIFWGMGKIPNIENVINYKQKGKSKFEKDEIKRKNLENLKTFLVPYPENFVVMSYINNYAIKNPDSIINI